MHVLVGSEEKLFQVHEDVLRSNSEFFAAALKKEWTEGQTRVVKLPEESEHHFCRYVQYLYSGTIACQGTNIATEFMVLAWMYVFGEQVLDTGF